MEPGFVLIDKELHQTSFDVVNLVRKITGIKKVGHCGTLDPLASGLLIVAIGRPATRRIDEFRDLPKEYITTVDLSANSTTDDAEGEKLN